ncbi:MAG: cupin domain-containing protein [Pseudomonadota bacterium]
MSADTEAPGRPIGEVEARCSNLLRHRLQPETGCHGGEGTIAVFRPFQREAGSPTAVDFIDLVVMPPGATIGRHRHGDNEEWYVILAGSGRMWFGGEWRAVRAGDILVNPPHGEHELRNGSAADIQLLVFQTSDGRLPPGQH